MIEVSYAFYALPYHGPLSEADFVRYGVRAAAFLDELTSQRITDKLPNDVQNKVKLAFCALCDAYAKEESANIASEQNDGISVTYAAQKGSAEERLRKAAEPFLSGTGLLYRGCRF